MLKAKLATSACEAHMFDGEQNITMHILIHNALDVVRNGGVKSTDLPIRFAGKHSHMHTNSQVRHNDKFNESELK